MAEQLMKLLKKDLVVYLSDGNTLKEPTVFRVDGSKKNDLITEDEKQLQSGLWKTISMQELPQIPCLMQNAYI